MQSEEAIVSSKLMKRTSTHVNSKDTNQSQRNTQNFNQSQYEEPQNVLQMLRQQSIQNQTIIKTKQPKQSDDNSYKQIPLLSKTISISQRKSTTGLEEQSPYLRNERYNSNIEEQIKAMEKQRQQEDQSPDRDFSSLSQKLKISSARCYNDMTCNWGKHSAERLITMLKKVNHSVHESQPSQEEFDGQITGKNIASPKISNLIKDSSNYIIDGKDYNSKRQSQRSLGTTSQRKNLKLQREIPDTQPFLRKDISQGVFINKEIISSNYSYEQNQWTNQTDVTPFVKMLDKNMIQWERKKQVLNKMYEQDKKYNDYKFQKQYFSPPKELIVRNESYNSNLNKQSQRQQNNRNAGHVFINKSAFQNYKKLVNMANYQAEVRTSHL
ncbi:UNKNOWN [Stylonychia lemnae]|uniref:Uncharacterized protein n=1 Tax=Stylonychia lemnae TaxID=5949 RepID=A0A078ACT5_STYLE|nr:UNKNOWN [Stylonychia lemnae]|eukprot:CDW80004.1 UNKNOWN [Stylonychia lemnae]